MSGAGAGNGLATTTGAGCWPSGVGTTIPFCTRCGKGAGALGRGLLDVEGHGGSGVVVLHATKSKGASTTKDFQYPGRNAVSAGCAVC